MTSSPIRKVALLLVVATASILLSSLTGLVYGQSSSTTTIRGRIYDDDLKEWITAASVRILNPSDSTLVKGALTDQQGAFSLSGLPRRTLLVEVSFIGYTPYSKQVRPAKDSSTIDLGTIHLRPSTTALQEFQVVGQSNPVTMKTDTVQFNAGAFRVRPGASIEELLRRIPGMEVDSEGKVTYNGEAIEKIELDGRDFFSGDPTLATRNLPANLIKNIQVVDKKSEQSRLTGMDDGEKVKVLNLNVKEELKKGFLTNLEAGYGTKDRYKMDAMGLYFRGDARYTLLGDMNNTDGVRRGRGDRTHKSIGANYDNKFGDKLNVNAEVSYRDNGNELKSTVHRENLLGSDDSSTIEDEESLQTGSNRGLNFGGRLEWTPSEQTSLFFMPSASIGKNHSESGSTFTTTGSDGSAINKGESLSLDDSDSNDYGGTLHFRHTFNDAGRNIYVRLYGRRSTNDGLGTKQSTTDFATSGRSEVIDQQTTSTLESNSGGISLSYLEPLSTHWALQANYRINGQSRNNSRLAYNADDNGDYTILDKTYSRGSENRNTNQEIGLRLRYSWGEKRTKSNIYVGFNALPTYTHTITTDGEEVTHDQSRNIVNYAPSVMMDLKPQEKFQMMLHYMGRTDQPSMDQLNPVTIQTSPLSQTVGNPDLLPSFRHSVFTRAFYNDREKRTSVQLFGFFNSVNNAVINRRQIDRETGISKTTYENVNGVLSARGGITLSLPVTKQWTSYTNGWLSYNRNKAYVNNELNTSNTIRPTLSQRFTWSGDYVQATLGASGTMNKAVNSISDYSNRQTLDYSAYNELTWDTPWGLHFSHRIAYSNADGYTDDVKRELWIWDLSLGYSFLKDRRATLQLEAQDLLAQRNTFRRSTSAQAITDTLYEGVTSYVMLTFSYKFNSLGADASMGMSNSRRYGRGRHGHF